MEETEITQDNLILEDLEETRQETISQCFELTFLDKPIRAIRNYCFNKNEVIYDNWEFETNLTLTEKDKETIKLFCEEQDNQ